MILKCKTITNMFSSGASQSAEFRPSEFKANMMYWWRAFHPNLVINENYENMRREEAKLFGGKYKPEENTNDKKDKFLQSRFRINITSDDIDSRKTKNPKEHLVYHRRNNPQIHKRVELECIEYGTEFKIELSYFNPAFGVEKSDKKLDYLKNIFELSTILGGVGRRARKGNGCWVYHDENNQIKILDSAESILKIIKQINKDIYEKDSAGNIVIKPSVTKSPQYPYVKKIFWGTKMGTAINLVNHIDTVLADLHQGLNLDQESNKLNNSISLNLRKYEANFGKSNRLSSPIYFSIIPADGSLYRIIATLLNTVHLQNNIITDENIQETVINYIINEQP